MATPTEAVSAFSAFQPGSAGGSNVAKLSAFFCPTSCEAMSSDCLAFARSPAWYALRAWSIASVTSSANAGVAADKIAMKINRVSVIESPSNLEAEFSKIPTRWRGHPLDPRRNTNGSIGHAHSSKYAQARSLEPYRNLILFVEQVV